MAKRRRRNDAECTQALRSRLFIQLDGLTDMAEALHFFEALADVALLHSRYGHDADRELWGCLGEKLKGCLADS
jgi:hypothetical protein